jgi:hypothetical protein
MKQKIYYLGLLSAILMSVGALLKVNHLAGAAILITLGSVILMLVFMPAALINHYRTEGEKKNMLLYLVTFLTVLVVFTAILFKIMHWPYTGILLLIALPFPFVIFLPVFLIVTARNKNFSIYNTVSVMLLLALNSVFTALLALNVSRETVNDSYTISANYLKTSHALADLPLTGGQSAVNAKIDEVLLISGDYRNMLLKNEGLTVEMWKNNPGGLLAPENFNTAISILMKNGEMPPGKKLDQAMSELISIMSQTKGYEETAKALPSILGFGASNGENEIMSFYYRNIFIPLAWTLIYLDGVEANLGMIRAAGPAI